MTAEQRADNPFAAPATLARERPAAVPVTRYAGFWWRVLAALVDMLVLLPVTGIAKANEFWWHVPAIGYASLAVYPLYKVLMEARGGTVGKFACGIRIIDAAGHEPGLGRSLSRNIPVIVSNLVNVLVSVFAAETLRRVAGDPQQFGRMMGVFLPSMLVGLFVLADYITVAINSQKRALHDMWAGTWCVRPGAKDDQG